MKGIGPKAALDLIQRYQTVENIYEHIDEITGSVKEKLVADKEMALKSKHLVTRMTVPGWDNIDPKDIENKIDFTLLKDVLLNKYEFSSMAKGIDTLKKVYETPTQ